MTPARIQRRRSKGWKMPPNTVYVGRPTKWGNPYPINEAGTPDECVHLFALDIGFQNSRLGFEPNEVGQLRGKNLACWCSLCEKHQAGKPMGVECYECAPCHVDVLLGVANAE